jgi:pyruvate,orthophosphate dikinase
VDSATLARYRNALAELERFQTQDFLGILRVSGGRPITIRLLDAPLHEFLPHEEEIKGKVQELRRAGREAEAQEQQRLLETVQGVQEFNPMLGHRGCRLGITFPAIYDMQMRAILTAAAQLVKEGLEVRPEIMIPLAGHANELQLIKERLLPIVAQVEQQAGVKVPYKFGTMIEVPRAALTAGEFAGVAEFFSFGTNDLTQMTYGYSRDDAERKFLRTYVDQGVLPANPFSTLDTEGVGRLMRLATEEGRRARPNLKVGICGEHGGDPASVVFCHQIGLDYVSASPFRVPVARLAAAQAAIREQAPR